MPTLGLLGRGLIRILLQVFLPNHQPIVVAEILASGSYLYIKTVSSPGSPFEMQPTLFRGNFLPLEEEALVACGIGW